MKKKIPVESNSSKVKIIVPIIAALAICIGYYFILNSHESTDNAYLKADVTILRPKVTGYLNEILIEDNQHVKEGTIVARINDEDYQARLKQAEANFQLANAKILTIEEQIKLHQNTIKDMEEKSLSSLASLDRAKKELDRANLLAKDKAISTQIVDKAIENEKTAQAVYNSSKENVNSSYQQLNVLNAQSNEAKAMLENSNASLELAKIDLKNTILTMPVDGYISKRNLIIGNLIQPGQALAYVVPSDKVWVVANFKEVQIQNMKAGQEVRIEVDSYPGEEFKGVIDSLSPASGAEFSVLPPENATGNFTKIVQRIPVKINIINEGSNKSLKPGMSCIVTLTK